MYVVTVMYFNSWDMNIYYHTGAGIDFCNVEYLPNLAVI